MPDLQLIYEERYEPLLDLMEQVERSWRPYAAERFARHTPLPTCLGCHARLAEECDSSPCRFCGGTVMVIPSAF